MVDAGLWTAHFMKLFLLAAFAALISHVSADGEKWTPLFNGKDLSGWIPKIRGCKAGENFQNTFRAEDGVIKVDYRDYQKWDKRFGHLFFDKKFSHYRLRLEYRFVGEQVADGPGWAFRNNGVMIHSESPATMELEQDFAVSLEVQILGGTGKGERTTGNLCTPGTHVEFDGKLDTRHCIIAKSKTFNGDQWVKLEIEVHGNRLIRHLINGEEVMSYGKPDAGWRSARRVSGRGRRQQPSLRRLLLPAIPKPSHRVSQNRDSGNRAVSAPHGGIDQPPRVFKHTEACVLQVRSS